MDENEVAELEKLEKVFIVDNRPLKQRIHEEMVIKTKPDEFDKLHMQVDFLQGKVFEHQDRITRLETFIKRYKKNIIFK